MNSGSNFSPITFSDSPWTSFDSPDSSNEALGFHFDFDLFSALSILSFLCSFISLVVFSAVYCIFWRIQTITKRYYFAEALLWTLLLVQLVIEGFVSGLGYATGLCFFSAFFFNFTIMAANLYHTSMGILLLLTTTSNIQEEEYTETTKKFNAFTKQSFIRFELWNHLVIILASLIFAGFASLFYNYEYNWCFFSAFGLFMFFFVPYTLLGIFNIIIICICAVYFCAPRIIRTVENPVSLNGKPSNFRIHLVKEFIVYLIFTIVNILVPVSLFFAYLFPFPLLADFFFIIFNTSIGGFAVLLCAIYVVFNPFIWNIVMKKRVISTASNAESVPMDEINTESEDYSYQ